MSRKQALTGTHPVTTGRTMRAVVNHLRTSRVLGRSTATSELV